MFTAEQIAERLSDRFSLLVTGSRTVLPRHQTLRAAIEWSYDLLSQPEQVLLMQLSAFAGVFTIGSDDSLGHVLECLGYNLLTHGDPSNALTRFQEGVKMSHRAGNIGGVAIGLAGIAGVSQAQGNVQRAAKLCGFAAKFSNRVSIEWMPAERAYCERAIANARTQLNDPTLAAAWDEGRAMTLEQAIEYALGDELNE
jgi:hypothetical protein